MFRISRVIPLLTLGTMAVAGVAPVSSDAAVFRNGDTLMVSSPIADDAYMSGGTVRMSAAIDGDLFVAGGSIHILSEIQEDAMIAGGNVRVSGTVQGDVRVAGGDVTISGEVGGDVLVFGGSVTIAETANINGDVVVIAGNATLLGTVQGSLYARGGQLDIGGTIRNDIDVRSGNVLLSAQVGGSAVLAAPRIDLVPGANIAGNVRYWNERGDIDFTSTVRPGVQPVFDATLAHPARNTAEEAGRAVGAFAVGLFFSALLFLFLMAMLVPGFIQSAGARLQARPWTMLLYGFLFVVLTPIIALLFFVTVIGIPLGIFVVILYAFILWFSWSIASLAFGQWIVDRTRLPRNRGILFLVASGVYIIFVIVGLLPIVGWIVQAVAVLMAFGAFATAESFIWKRMMRDR